MELKEATTMTALGNKIINKIAQAAAGYGSDGFTDLTVSDIASELGLSTEAIDRKSVV